MNKFLRQFRVLILGACLLSMVATSGTALPASAEGTAAPGFDEFVNTALDQWHVPGACVAVVKDGKILLTKGYGLRTVGTNDKVDENTIFAIGSCTKAFTSAAIAKLVGEGKLGWDDKVVKYVPTFQVSDPWVTYHFSIRDLLCMRSGLGNTDSMITVGGFTRDQTLAHLSAVPFAHDFRTTFTYVNLMYMVAGEVQRAITGTSWSDYVTESFLKPLAMTRTSTNLTALKGDSNVATPHMTLKGQVIAVPYMNIESVAPAGAINSTANDMAKWLQMQLGEGKFGQKTLVEKTALEETHTPQFLCDRHHGAYVSVLGVPPVQAYCMGWGLVPMEGEFTVQHDGGIDGMRSTTLLVPDKSFGVSVLTNSQYGDGKFSEAIAYRAMETYLEHTPHEWSAEYLKLQRQQDATELAALAKLESSRVSGTRPSVALDQYAGTYQNPADGNITISKIVANSKPILHLQAEYPLTFGDMTHWNYDTFQVKMNNPVNGDSLVVFQLDANGKVESLTMDGEVFRRIK